MQGQTIREQVELPGQQIEADSFPFSLFQFMQAVVSQSLLSAFGSFSQILRGYLAEAWKLLLKFELNLLHQYNIAPVIALKLNSLAS